jgi:hypothetical protein
VIRTIRNVTHKDRSLDDLGITDDANSFPISINGQPCNEEELAAAVKRGDI